MRIYVTILGILFCMASILTMFVAKDKTGAIVMTVVIGIYIIARLQTVISRKG